MGKTKGKPDIFTRFATFVPITAPPFPTSGMQPTPYIDIHTHRRSNDPYVIDAYAVGSDGSLPAGPYSAGIHPWEVQRITPDNTSRYRQDLLDALTPRCIAVGEIGLDYAVTGDSVLRTAQRHWFEQQMELAADRSLPVIIHCVRAYNDLIPISRNTGDPRFYRFAGIGRAAVASRRLPIVRTPNGRIAQNTAGTGCRTGRPGFLRNG